MNVDNEEYENVPEHIHVPKPNTPLFEPSLLVELAAAEVVDAPIDSPQYRVVRYSEPPTNGTLSLLVALHKYINEANENNIPLTQTSIAEALSTHQPKISRLMNDYPNIFQKSNGTYVAYPLPDEFLIAYSNQESKPVTYSTGLTNNEREINRKLDKIIKLLQQPPVETPARPEKRSRAFLDDAVIDLLLAKMKRDPIAIEWARDHELGSIMGYMMLAIERCEREYDVVMQRISKFANKNKDS